MPRCRGEKPNGAPCERIVGASQEYCYSHDPAREEERRRNASRAGRSKPSGEIKEVKALLKDLTARVLGEEGCDPIETSRAAVANQLANTRLRAAELERKIKETEDLEERLLELEEKLGDPRRGARSGAWR